MKILLVLLFAFTFPIVIFLTTVLYGGTSPTVLKEELAKASVYSKLTEFLSHSSEDKSDDTAISDVLISTFTPTYTQTKVEEVIDSSYGWVTGTNSQAPQVAFPEIKQQILSQHPDLLTQIESMSDELQQPVNTEGMSDEEAAQEEQMHGQLKGQMEMMQTFIKNDFSLPLEKQLSGFRNLYKTLRILQPVLSIVLVLLLILLGYLNHTWPARFKWLGITLLISGITGFIAIALQAGIVGFLNTLSETTTNEAVSIATPIMLAIIRYFVKTYTNYQGIASFVLLILSAGCFVAASLKGNEKPAFKPATTKSSKKK